MGRARAFEEREALDAAMLVFWHQGYRATSMKDLEDATELKPGSLYHAFGNKRALFLRVIDHYIERVITARVHHYLECDGPPLEELREFITSAFAHVSKATPSPACLLLNTAVELGMEDVEVHSRVATGMRLVERGMQRQIQRAQALGQIAECVDPKAAARGLAVAFQGILVASRMTSRRASLMELTDQAMHQLGLSPS